MAERRMFAKTIIDSDAFLDMPVTARLLYYDLGMRADDDGFVNSPKKIMRVIGASDDDMRILLARKFIIAFESGIVVIKHWRLNNYLRKDRYNETQYSAEKALLELDENGKYHLKKTECQPSGLPTVDTGKDRLGKDRLGNIKEIVDAERPAPPPKKSKFTPPTIEELKSYISEKNLNVDPEAFMDYYTANGWKVGRNSMKDWKAAAGAWSRREKQWTNKPGKKLSWHPEDQRGVAADFEKQLHQSQGTYNNGSA